MLCVVEQAGELRSRQGINLPGVTLRTPSLTDKDRSDLAWAVAHALDYVGLSFVRSADDIRLLHAEIDRLRPETRPAVVAKIEKMEALNDLDNILEVTDAVMVARAIWASRSILPGCRFCRSRSSACATSIAFR